MDFPIIHLPTKSRVRTNYVKCWADISDVEDLPDRLFVGDLDRASFIMKENGDFEVSYRSEEFHLSLERRGEMLWIEEHFDGRFIVGMRVMASRNGAAIVNGMIRPNSIYDDVLKPLLEGYYVQYIETEKSDLESSTYFPDGSFQALLVPFPLDEALCRSLVEALTELSKKNVAFNGFLDPTMVVVNLVEGKCPDVPDVPATHQVWAVERGYIPLETPQWEGTPGDRALTARLLSYVLRITFPLRDVLTIVECLSRHGVLENPNSTSSERIGIVMPSEMSYKFDEVAVWTPDRSRRVVILGKSPEYFSETVLSAKPNMQEFGESMISVVAGHHRTWSGAVARITSGSPDLGRLFLDKISEKMMIDEEWSVREPHRIEWWPHELRQSIWVDGPFDDEGMTIWRVHCRTDLIRGFGGTHEEQLLVMEKAMYLTLSGFARNPQDPSKVQTASSIYFHEETFDWALEMMSWIAGLQAMEAHRDADPLAEKFPSWEADTTAHPESGPRPEPDDLLNLGQLALSKGMSESHYTVSEMERVKDLLDGPPSLLTTGDGTVINAEYGFPERSMFFQASTREFNMNFGHGLLTILRLPGNPDGKLPVGCLEFNEKELQSLTRSHFVGSWCDDLNGTRTFVTFLPNALFSPATIERMVMSVMMRAMWISHDLLDYSWAEHYQQDLTKKTQSLQAFSGATQGKPSILKRLFGGRP